MEVAFKESRKDQIINTSARLFRERGYVATSMRHLGQEIGIEPASIYNHVASKEEILKLICYGMADRFFLTQKNVQSEFQSENILKKLEASITAHIRTITANLDAAPVFFHDWRYLTGASLKTFRAMQHEYEAIFSKMIKSGMDEGYFKQSDIKFTVLTLFSAMNWTYEWYKPDGSKKPEEVGKGISNIFLNGISIQNKLKL
jgi:TetR/AcrR family transcriptional regulator, cholesterol catabolism regulator